MLWQSLTLAALLATVSASPVPATNSGPFEAEIKAFFTAQRAGLKIVKTTTTPKGQQVDWIPLASQGKVAPTPPLPAGAKPDGRSPAIAELNLPGAQVGPAGSVPVLRTNLAGISFDKPLESLLVKPQGVTDLSNLTSPLAPRAGPGTHRYGSSQQRINNYGSSGHLNIYNPYVQTVNDFSLLQTGIINDQQGYLQTAEAGWQKYQGRTGDASVHLFTYYTTNGYASGGNNIGGYDRTVAGWVQVSTKIFPGTIFSPTSIVNGQQYEITIRFQLYQGNWWLWVQNEWIGYYPATLYKKGGSIANTLGNIGTIVGWWGEVYDDQTSASGKTTTDMGSGRFPTAGGSAYMDYLLVQTNAGGTLVDYDGSAGLYAPNTDMYQIQAHFKSGTSFGSYAFVGGPGSG